jgi:hypothetical protein
VGDQQGGESEPERLNRELIELLNELRVALPGVQVLFAFLLVLPFQNRFRDLDRLDRSVYFAALATTALSSVLLIAPSMHHRLRFRSRNKDEIVFTANKLAIAGMTSMAVAISLSLYLVSDFLYGGIAGVATAVAALVAFALVWYVLPYALR